MGAYGGDKQQPLLCLSNLCQLQFHLPRAWLVFALFRAQALFQLHSSAGGIYLCLWAVAQVSHRNMLCVCMCVFDLSLGAEFERLSNTCRVYHWRKEALTDIATSSIVPVPEYSIITRAARFEIPKHTTGLKIFALLTCLFVRRLHFGASIYIC